MSASSRLTVTALQLPPCTSDLASNEAVAFDAVRAAAAAGAQLIALPELSMVPYFASAPAGRYCAWAESASGPLGARCAALAKQCGAALFVPVYEFDPATGRYHNAVLGFDAEGKPLRAGPVARKLHLPVGDDPSPGYDEAAHFTPGDALQGTLAAGLQQNGVSRVDQALHQRHHFAFLQHGLAAGDLHQAGTRTQPLNFLHNFFQRSTVSAGERIFAVAPGTTQITSRKSHKDTRQPSVCGLALDRLVNLGNLHEGSFWLLASSSALSS